ncbi:MAG: BamA/TamA family outer membrane protein [Fidelibacterota bacterium]|nr:MAG: BamA/TamA family outer membrane protein [Candidatus Neomarinimicrobiota bacterium]
MKWTPSVFLGLILALSGLPPGSLLAQEKPAKRSGKLLESLGLLPFVRFSEDQGFGYGLVVQWDDKRSPEYTPYYLSHRFSFERTTRNIQDYIYRFDSKYLLPADLRLTFEARYQASLFEPYHGPGGAQTRFDDRYIAWDGDADQPEYPDHYRGKFYYMYDKRYVQVNTLVQGWLKEELGLRWLAGLNILSTKVDTVTYTDFVDDDPGEQTLLAHQWASLGADTAGGSENGLMAGVVWDRRDHETSPHEGFWSEILLRWVPDLLGNDFAYTVFTATHRQYVPLSRTLTFAFRLGGRFMTAGAPFFSVPRLDGSFTSTTGLGGNSTVRGVLWQRAVGKRYLYGNLELRFRFLPLLRTGYMAASGFYDFGRSFDDEPAAGLYDKGAGADRLHQGLGFGLRIAPSNTFILALDLGFPVDGDLDGPGLKVYMGLDWLF